MFSLLNKSTWLILTGVLSIGISSNCNAATWIAICNDGQNLQYNQTLNGKGLLYLKVKDSSGKTHTWQIAKLDQTFYNGTAICGTVPGNGVGNAATGSNPVTQVCANKSRKTIYVKYKHPYEVRPFESGVFCNANVTVR
ncbi:hypothetical protein [Kaarinaea lacus]